MLVLALSFVAAIAYALWPRHADLRRFDPVLLARNETLAWRHYYEKRYAALAFDLYALSRTGYGFSPWDSARLAYAAARAASAFQPSRSREEAAAALPDLTAYFAILAKAAPVPVDAAATARLELAWWHARREAVPPEEYGRLVAAVAARPYGVDDEKVREYGIRRAEAMAYRDAHEAGMTEADWQAISDQLEAAYRRLSDGVAPKGRD
jgi:hypothetical protein